MTPSGAVWTGTSQYLRENTPAGLSEDVLKLAENVRDAGGAEGQGDYFDRLVARLELVVNERDLIEENADILDDLLEQIDHLSVGSAGR